MALTITGLLGYAQFYKDGAPVFRIPVFSATGSTGNSSSEQFSTDLSVFNATFIPHSAVSAISPNWSDVRTNYPPPSGTPSTSKTGASASITSYARGSDTIFSKTNSSGKELGSGFSLQFSFYPIIIKYSGFSYQMGLVRSSLVGGEMNNSTTTRYVDVDLDIFDKAEDSKMTNFYLADFSGENPVEREQPIKLERLQSTELRFCAVYEDGTFEEWTGEVGYDAVRGDGAFSIAGNTITILEDARVPNVTLLARPVYDNLDGDIYASVAIDVTNPVSPYTPPQGGGGGPGAGGGSGLPSGTGGGGGSFPSDPGPSLVDRIPNGQTGNDIAQSGLFTMYLMNQQYMTLMGEILWEDNVAIQAIKEIFGNPIDSVISTISYPFSLLNLVQYGAQNLYIGPWDTGLPFQALTKSSFQIDWGTISIPFAWGNFLDYSPHTKMELFLPWGPGYVTIDPNDVSPFSNTAGNFNVSTFTAGSIQVKTNVELGKGTCVHNVIGNNGRVIGSYSGIVGKQVPITALDTGGKALTTISAASSIVGGVVAGSIAAKGAMDTGRLTGTPMKDPMRPFESASYWDTGMISGRASAQSLINTGHNLASRAINSTPITFPRAGTFSDGSSAMTVQTPFLIISRPVQSVPTQYGHYNGYPSNIHYPNFLNIFGYTEISEIHLDNVTATADELQELDTILKGGILL